MRRLLTLLALVTFIFAAPSGVRADSSGYSQAIERLAAATGIERPSLDQSTPIVQLAACCKVCSTGKACGDSCISRSKQCHKGQGCACDGYAPPAEDRPARQ